MGVDLGKKAEQVRVSLAKKGIIKAPTFRVGAAFDESTSMDGTIKNGDLQLAFNQLMGVSIEFDDNGELDCLAFNDRCRSVGTASPGNFETFVDRNIHAGGSTKYAPIVRMSAEMFFQPQPTGGLLGRLLGRTKTDITPVLMMILTDGQNDDDDHVPIERALAAVQHLPMFFHFVGIGGTSEKFPQIGRLARTFANAGEVYLPRFNMPDSAIYEQLITDKLVGWIKQFPS